MRSCRISRSSLDRLYAGLDPVTVPSCSIAEAAKWLDLPTATLRGWAVGGVVKVDPTRYRFRPVFDIAGTESKLLSFENLTESFVLSVLRRRYSLSLQRVRWAIEQIEKRLGVDHPLAKRVLYTDGREILIKEFGNLVNLTRHGQMEMEALVSVYLHRIHWADDGRPGALFPIVDEEASAEARERVEISPRVQFGRPCLAGTRIPTSMVAQRVKAGDAAAEVAADLGLELDDVEAALRFEQPKRSL